MEFQILLCVSFIAILQSGVQSATFTVKNKCPFTIWPGTLTGAGNPQLSSTGLELPSSASTSIEAPPGWSGRFWARSGCTTDSSGRFSCLTGDCASGQVTCNGAGAIPPVTLIELTLGVNGALDFFDVSLVDGFNLPVALVPQNGCASTSCPVNVNTVCPTELAVKDNGTNVVACKSACLAFNTPQYCCTGAFGSPETCPPTNFSKIFKAQCPQAYSYAYDDKTSTFTCGGGPNYAITFCP